MKSRDIGSTTSILFIFLPFDSKSKNIL